MSTDTTPNPEPSEPVEPTAPVEPTGSADPTDPDTAPETAPETAGDAVAAPKPDRKRAWQVGAALLLTLVTGAATAVAVTLPDRTDLPGLATPNDGRYTFPELTLPPLPAGASAPAEYKIKTHAADLRGLLLPLPKGAVGTGPSAAPSATGSASPSASPSPSASESANASVSASASASLPPVAGRWMPCDLDMMLAKDESYGQWLISDACRGAAAQGWTAKDGTRTELRLIHFGSQDEAGHFFSSVNLMPATKDIENSQTDFKGNYAVALGQVNVRLSDAEADGVPTGRIGWVQCGDVVALVQMTNPHGVPSQAFHQVVLLQSSLLV
ncbi:hypothetical protein [Kitasatospora sp. CB01950]|uniref:hypothetical protein n=1 Tax=Kitasatospora sp. CB01950 TaxID=1703930 RepID=UPI00093CF007|nr:hypothetical protein [Kitasatospora sp. CB01950]OKJ00032.1 hypothetical protein AMK19_30220 [Kitasatospora sp. CB01950]